MSNAGLDNWKRDYPPADRAMEILRAIVAARPTIHAQGPGFEVPGAFWSACAEAEALIAEVDQNDAT